MLENKKVLLLDMNSTFMFGEDRFDQDQDFSIYYQSIGGKLERDYLDRIIRAAYDYLDERYPDESYRENFPTVEHAINETLGQEVPQHEKQKIIDTFGFHELGAVPEDYVEILNFLRQHFVLSAVIDIWSPKKLWLDLFERLGILELFSALSFSSDHGIVKPSPFPYEMIVKDLNVCKQSCLVVGDSLRRDLGAAQAAGIDCIMVGGATDKKALKSYSTLLEFGSYVKDVFVNSGVNN